MSSDQHRGRRNIYSKHLSSVSESFIRMPFSFQEVLFESQIMDVVSSKVHARQTCDDLLESPWTCWSTATWHFSDCVAAKFKNSFLRRWPNGILISNYNYITIGGGIGKKDPIDWGFGENLTKILVHLYFAGTFFLLFFRHKKPMRIIFIFFGTTFRLTIMWYWCIWYI